ncbi:MAG: aspartate aminotransferase family protein [Acidobacteria bacterium]|nr:MAG: aspartate aminotransferase family protein [Acidobacteriota bacterium]PYV75186.1 MAG: aspartate aminotransferase family protein [Acidobacteriota bacterium]
MSNTIQKYKDYVMTGFMKSVAPIAIERASGCSVWDEAGREYLDCFSGISVVNAGHNNPRVIAAAKAQMEKLVHCASYLYHAKPVADLAEKIAQIAPSGLTKTFFGNGGAEAIEGALKLARLYSGKHEFISLHASFHGRSWGTLSITGNQARKKRGGPYAPGIAFAPTPYVYRSLWPDDPDRCAAHCAKCLDDVIRFETSGDVAAFIAEPVLGEGGIIVPPANYFGEIKKVLDRHGILFIADEVQSGFGRTGKMFAIEHYGVTPDILVTAKGIADGFPLSAFTTRPEIAAAYKPGDHLSTFGGNPVSCAAALANIQFMQNEDLPTRAAKMGEYAIQKLQDLQKQNSIIGEVRGLGLMIGVELVRDEKLTPANSEAEAIRDSLLRQGVLIGVGGVYGNVVRFQPPLIITKEQINHAMSAFASALAEVAQPATV